MFKPFRAIEQPFDLPMAQLAGKELTKATKMVVV
jgi:hypothetical protein